MGFNQTKNRYASFGIVTSMPGKLIDSFWYIIDTYLKGVVPMRNKIKFEILNNDGLTSVIFSQKNYKHKIRIDLPIAFDPFYPHTVMIIDKKGTETIVLPDEIS